MESSKMAMDNASCQRGGVCSDTRSGISTGPKNGISDRITASPRSRIVQHHAVDQHGENQRRHGNPLQLLRVLFVRACRADRGEHRRIQKIAAEEIDHGQIISDDGNVDAGNQRACSAHRRHAHAVRTEQHDGRSPDQELREGHTGDAEDFPGQKLRRRHGGISTSIVRVVFSSSTERMVMMPYISSDM